MTVPPASPRLPLILGEAPLPPLPVRGRGEPPEKGTALPHKNGGGQFDQAAINRRLIKMGLMDAQTGATRKARAVVCTGCRAVVMRGIGASWGGYVIDADPIPLSRLGEALALLAGRVTVELRMVGDHYEIDRRNQFRIRGSPAGTNGIDVLVVHDCELSPGQEYPHLKSTLRDNSEAIPLPVDPPF